MLDEHLLQFIWKHKLFDTSQLITCQGEQLQIINGGIHNHDEGPDFLEAKIRLNETIWAGHIELHILASDWFRHAHQKNKKYDNVILHVVYVQDRDICELPTLELKPLIPHDLLTRYRMLMASQHSIACHTMIGKVDAFVKWQWQERMMIERLQRKSEEVLQLIDNNNGHVEEAFYIHLLKYVGRKINKFLFEKLAEKLPLKVLVQNKNNLVYCEALLFGVAGFLQERHTDSYIQALQHEFTFLRNKYKLIVLDHKLWNFARMRPAGFPTISLALLAQLIHQSQHLITKLCNENDIDEVKKMLEVEAHSYWDTHYHLGKKSTGSKKKRWGKTQINLLLINVVIPFVFAQGKRTANEAWCDKALQWLLLIPEEHNTITKTWQSLQMPNNNAAQSQALIQLSKEYCEAKRCLECAIGLKIIRK